MAKALNVTAVVLHYRRAPEHPFPAQIEDAVAAYKALLDKGFDTKKIYILRRQRWRQSRHRERVQDA